MRRIAYLRMSTGEQCPDRQIDGLQAISDELHIETLSAVSKKRPIYEALVAGLQAGDVLVVWDLDRAFRCAKDALFALDTLRERGIHFHIANLHLDTTTPEGRFMYIVMSGLAEFERETIVRRTKEGIAAARARGKRIGRPPKLTADQLCEAAARLSDPDMTITAVAGEFDVWPWTLSRALKRTPAEAEH